MGLEKQVESDVEATWLALPDESAHVFETFLRDVATGLRTYI